MRKYVALFRGINVGGHHKLPMADLVKILKELKCEEIQTYIQSGNVVFSFANDISRLANRIENEVEKVFGFVPKVLLIEARTYKIAMKNCPFVSNKGKDLLFYFLESEPKGFDRKKLEGLKVASESFSLNKKVFYLHAPDGIGRSKLAASVEKILGVATTARNYNTAQKILEILCG